MATSIPKKTKMFSLKQYVDIIKRLIFDPSFPTVTMMILFVAEIFVNVFVIWRIKYTEIDWVAYMQEVEGVVNGTYDYSQLRGDTGPLVYPAGFVYLFMGLYYLTGHGLQIRLAQYIFVGIYLLNLIVVFDIYRISKKIPPYVFIFMCALSYRIHSIYILRLFNDPVAMLFLYIAISLFMRSHWSWGCLFYSLGVSIKMNLLLFSPALLFLLLASQGIKGTIVHLTICAVPQILLALPFLMANPVAYIIKSFDLSRQFFYIWTVNWRLLPEEIFLNKHFQASLLACHVFSLLVFFNFKWRRFFPDFKLSWSRSEKLKKLTPDQILFPLLTSNFIGMCFSRSLHYQFYVWYFHGLHYLAWCCPLPTVVRILLLGCIEFSWNTYPSTVFSSALLHVCHGVILLCLFLSQPQSSQENQGQGQEKSSRQKPAQHKGQSLGKVKVK